MNDKPMPCGEPHEVHQLNEHSYYETIIATCNRPKGHEGNVHYAHAVSVVWEGE